MHHKIPLVFRDYVAEEVQRNFQAPRLSNNIYKKCSIVLHTSLSQTVVKLYLTQHPAVQILILVPIRLHNVYPK